MRRLALFLVFAAACGDGTSVDLGTPDAPDAHASLGDADAPPDAGADAAMDAGPPNCSADHVCHETLPAGLHTLRAVWADGQGIAWTVSEEGELLRFDGTTWSVFQKGGGLLRAIWGSGPTDLWAGGDAGLFHGTGATSATLVFQPVTLPSAPSMHITSIFGSGSDDVWVSASTVTGFNAAGAVFHLSAGAWTSDVALAARPTGYTQLFGGTAAGTWVAGTTTVNSLSAIEVFRRLPGRTAFEAVPMPPDPDPSFAVQPTQMRVFSGGAFADTNLLVVGRTGGNGAKGEGTVDGVWLGALDAGNFKIAYQRDGDLTPFGSSITQPFTNAVTSCPSGALWAVGDHGRFRRWNGKAFTQVAVTITRLPVDTSIYGLHCTSTSGLWAVGKDLAVHVESP